KRYSMRLWMDPQKMAAYKVTPIDVRSALTTENVELPSGRIEGDNTELTVRTRSRLETPEQFNDMIVREDNNRILRFRDVGAAMLGPEDDRSISKGLLGPRVALGLFPQPGSNHINISDEFYRRLKSIEPDLPKDVNVNIAWDTSGYIRKSIREVRETILTAFLLVIAIIFLFLRDWRTTLIPVLAVPISLIGVFFIMYACGFSINVLTLLGIVLAIGIVVDDAIVMLENIYAKIEDGLHPVDAGHAGSREVFFAIISTTITLIAVFMPIVFLQGLTGRLFKEFGIVVGGAVAISAFVALTLTAMLSSHMLRPHAHHSAFYRSTEPFFVRMTENYRRALDGFLRRRGWAAVIVAATIAVTALLLHHMPRELAPIEDRSRLRMTATAPEGTSFERMDHYMDGVIDLVRNTVPEADGVLANTAGFAGAANNGNCTVTLVPPEDRKRSQQQIADALSASVRNMNDARTFVTQEQTISVGGGRARFGLPVQFVIEAPNLDKLSEALPKFEDAARKSPVFSAVDVDLKFNKPELNVEIDRERARTLGVSVADIAQTLQLSLAGQRYGYFIKDGRQYEVIGQLNRASRDAPVDLASIYVRNRGGVLIPLDNVVRTTERTSPPQLYRFDRFMSATVSAGLAPGYTLGEGIKAMDQIADKVLDPSFHTSLAGASRDFADSSSSLVFVFLLALLLTYLVLAGQFESFRDPLVIMLTVPLALGGALISLWYFNQTLNIFSQIGMIMLIGLVTKNGILIVEFANQRKAAGLPVAEAIRSAAEARLRPILMTSLSTILGILPVALGLGAGSGSRISMGIAVVGGMVFATGLTLFVVPAFYSLLSKEKKAAPAPVPAETLHAHVGSLQP
ncbi:MAG TPA: efflux RND transporter permease subunit, partial [Candidatus Krumholzibacteria bacterium]|nr:efflux RND transporter permease subunit [Candidatus Krumholzibacteria bacterium]